MSLDWIDHRADPAAWAASLGCSVAACELLLDADFIDLHNDMEVPVRLVGWAPSRRHGPHSRVRRLYGHTDYPRLREARFTGVVYDIATNIARPAANRQAVTVANVAAAKARLGAHDDQLVLARTAADYDRAKASGRTAFWLALQGGNALQHDPTVLEGPLGQDLQRITLVHLSSSVLGGSNSPTQADQGLTAAGADFVARCNAHRIAVDLSHAGERTFWEAMDAHASDLPPIVSHAAMRAVHDVFRNISDAQAKAVADRGGVVGLIYQSSFLRPLFFGRAADRGAILDHLEHLIAVAGEDAAAIGTDYDGFIVPPHDLPDVTMHPLLVQDMLDRRWSEDRIRKVLGLNALRVIRELRPGKQENLAVGDCP